MNENIPRKPLEPGVYQGTPEGFDSKKTTAPRIIRTMKSDIAEAIKNQNETSVSIAIAEEKKRAKTQADALATNQAEASNVPPAPKPIGRIIVVIVIILLFVALLLTYTFILPKIGAIKLPSISIPSFAKPANTTTNKSTTKPATPLAQSLVPAQSEKLLSITSQTRTQLFAEISTEAKQQIPSGSIKNLYFTEESGSMSNVISANRLLIFAGISAPEILTRSLEKPFMAGFWGEQNDSSTPFVILKVSSKETGFAGMLEWESSLPHFFDTIFDTNIAGTITPTTKFHDIVVLGKDARIFNAQSKSALLYTFVNQNTIVIAGSHSALEALIPLAVKN